MFGHKVNWQNVKPVHLSPAAAGSHQFGWNKLKQETEPGSYLAEVGRIQNREVGCVLQNREVGRVLQNRGVHRGVLPCPGKVKIRARLGPAVSEVRRAPGGHYIRSEHASPPCPLLFLLLLLLALCLQRKEKARADGERIRCEPSRAYLLLVRTHPAPSHGDPALSTRARAQALRRDAEGWLGSACSCTRSEEGWLGSAGTLNNQSVTGLILSSN